MSSRAALVAILVGCGGGGDPAALDAGVDASSIMDAPADAGTCTPPVLPDASVPTGAACTADNLPGQCLETAACTGSRTPHAGACAGPATIQCCTPRFAAGVTCDPNLRPQPNACLVEEPGDPGCLPGMAKVDTFCVDRFEGSLETMTGAPVSPYAPPPAEARARSLRGAVPQGYLSQTQASAACTAAGKRLCTDIEWQRACRGASDTTYPYGDTRQPGVCNDARAQHPAVELYGTTDSWIFSHLDSPCLNQEASGLARTGSHTACVTGEGAFDMMGNLHEWTADPAGTFRGGFYADTMLNGNGCAYVTTAHLASYEDYSTGFRCCADASLR